MENDDYILRSNALKAIRYENWREENRIPSIEGLHLTKYQLLAEAINNIPAADVEPKRKTGYWEDGNVYQNDGHGETVRHPGGITCSRCRYSFEARYLWSREYCPHCGSPMLPEPPKGEDDAEVH